MNEFTVGREPFVMVELFQKCCSNRYGVSPCTATLGQEPQKCYNSFATCQDYAHFNLNSQIVWKFVKPDVNFTDCIPSLVSVNSTVTKINVGGGDETVSPFGRRSTCTIVLTDHPTDDSKDFYLADRGFDPLTRGTFWGKFLARNPYYANWTVNVYEGYVGQTLEQMQKRTYLIDKIAGPDSGGKVTITTKDPLKLGDDKRALVPVPSDGRLAVDINATQTAGIIIENSEGDILKQLGNTTLYYMRIGDEIISYTGATQDETLYTLTNVTRAVLGTEAEEHDTDDDASRVVRYESMPCWRVAYDLLTNFTEISSEYIPLDEWDAEGNVWLNIFQITGTVEESISVNELLGELCEQCLMYIWWDERASKVRLKAIRPEIDDIALLNDRDNIIQDSFSIKEDPKQRISRFIVYYNRKNVTEDIDKVGNYRNAVLRVDGDSEYAYNESRTKQVWSRWLTTEAQARQLSIRMLTRYKLNPRYITLKVDAKDRNINVGEVIMLETVSIQDPTGEGVTALFQVISVNEITQGETVQLELQSFEFEMTERYGFYTYDNALNYTDYTKAERIGKAFYADDNDKVAGDDPYLYS
ncbi:MAG: hypothetical protein LBP40_00365 [Campylobacteraceae bacterium]|nr:hypothetical protein [Campylobacteraceae bacterium]